MNTEFNSHKMQTLRDLLRGERITTISILNRYNTLRGSAIIHALRKDGWDIETNFIITKSHKRIAQYHLKTENV